MSVIAEVKYVHLVPYPSPDKDGFDGAFGHTAIVTGDLSTGLVQCTFYFGKPALEDNYIVLERIGYNSGMTAGSYLSIGIRSWFCPQQGEVEYLAASTVGSAASAERVAADSSTGLVRPRLVAFGMPIDQSDPYTVVMSREGQTNGTNYYFSICGRWKRKGTLSVPRP